MKKFFVIALAAMSTMFVSCSKSVDSQAKDYVQQMVEIMKSGDEAKGEALEKEMEAWIEGLSEADKQIADSVMEAEFQKVLPELMQAAFGGMMDQAGDAAEAIEEETEEAVDGLQEAVEGAAEDIKAAAQGAADDAVEAAKAAADEAKEAAKDAAKKAIENL